MLEEMKGLWWEYYMLIINIPLDTLTTFSPATFPQYFLRSRLLRRVLMLQMFYIPLQLLYFLFEGIKLCSCQGPLEFFFGRTLAIFVAVTTIEGEGFEEDGGGDKGDEDGGNEAGYGGERAQHGHGGFAWGGRMQGNGRVHDMEACQIIFNRLLAVLAKINFIGVWGVRLAGAKRRLGLF